MSIQKKSVSFGGKEISIETGSLARQADGAVLVSCGDDKVLVTVVSAREPSGVDFFPLTVEYQERFYSAGRIPGGFFKREGRPSHEAVLSARMIDRPIRPLFPETYLYDTQVVASVLSYSGEYPVEILAGLGASSALHVSDIPFSGPIASVQVSRVDGEFVLNPSPQIKEKSDIFIALAGTKNGILMVEGSSLFVPEKDILSALKFGHQSLQPLLDMQEELRQSAGSPAKRSWEASTQDEKLQKEVEDLYKDKILKALTIQDKKMRTQGLQDLKKEIQNHFNFEDEEKIKSLSGIYENIKYQVSRSLVLEGRRIDGRKMDEVRPIECQAGLLPRVHGSGLFTRGETQVLASVTLGTEDDSQTIDSLSGMEKKKFLLHYNFPPFCVGETGRLGGQSRREIGHGFLAEKALTSTLPNQEKFPYTIRIVSEVLESNGSSSMGTVCAGSLALMDAGVPVSSPVAGIAMGLIQEKDSTVVLSDILGDEDHLGDMDFKIAGSDKGVSAVQMDIKIDSLGFDVIEKALDQALKGRLHILSCMSQVLSKNREEISQYAPRIEVMKVPKDKLRDIIGSGGKMINSIIERTGVKIDIEDDGTVSLASPNESSIKKARDIIEKICEDAEVGKTYEGKVKKLAEFGAFIEILPNTTGLLHVSEIAHQRTENVSDVLREGQKVQVKVLNIQNGRIRLSMKALIKKS